MEDVNIIQTKNKNEIETKAKTVQIPKERIDKGEKKYKETVFPQEMNQGCQQQTKQGTFKLNVTERMVF